MPKSAWSRVRRRLAHVTRLSAIACPLFGAPQAAVAGGGDGDGGAAEPPRATVVDPAHYRGLLESSADRVVRVLVLGDSQETSPFGWGSHYLPHLNARFARTFGPTTESHLFTCVDAATPPQWLGTSSEAAWRLPPATAPSEVLPSVVVHGLVSGFVRAKEPSAAVFRSVFLHDASHCTDEALEGGSHFVASDSYVPEVLVRRTGPSPGLLWESAPTDGDLPDPTSSVVAGGFAPLPRAVPQGAWTWIALPELSRTGRRHLQVAVRGASDASGIDVAGIRYRHPGAPRGVQAQSFAKGGMRLPDLIGQHGASGGLLRALAPDLVVLCYGANDAGNLTDLATWREQLVAAIGWLRAATGRSDLPIVIATELRISASANAQAMIDAMPRIAHELALADPRVLALNLHRVVAEEYGWRDWRPYLADSAHLRPYAQRLLAEAFVGELCRTLGIDDPACDAAGWADCVRIWGSGCLPGGCRMLIDADAEALGLAWNGPGTTCADLDGDGGPDLCPPGGPGDANRDGFIDALDLAVVLAAWGTAGPEGDLDGSGLVDALDLAEVLGAWGS